MSKEVGKTSIQKTAVSLVRLDEEASRKIEKRGRLLIKNGKKKQGGGETELYTRGYETIASISEKGPLRMGACDSGSV